MRIVIVSSVDEDTRLEDIMSPNQVYVWFLHKAFTDAGVDVRLVKGRELKKKQPPETDHTIVVSSASLGYMITEPAYAQRLRASTKGKLTCYMNTDQLRGGERWFDYCFTQIAPRGNRPAKYVCVGWGVDPEYSYPEQDEKAAFLDSKVLHLPNIRGLKKVYLGYDNVLPKLSLKIHNPVPVYNKSPRLPYPDYQAILRKCHYFLCTQFGDGGLNRLEAAACGALLVVPAKFYRKKTMRLLNNKIWYNEEDLATILEEPVDIKANRERALEHRWEYVVKRMMDLLER